MKKMVFLALLFLFGILLLGCKNREEPKMDSVPPNAENDAGITFINGVKEADVWILPATEENLKTTLWGTATIAKLKTDEAHRLSLQALGGPGDYIIRMIDTEGMYYASDRIPLEEGYSLQIKKDDQPMSVVLEVMNADGVLVETYSVFAARL